ncbi:hypothetical protein [Novosphingobium aerophilum]|uniref:Uncharacterized protein n=1 Tax=Novosphingobium aerophilum TaxID=2839843 RepID=A0A7X1F8I9_9SPHN|nr:hypothetical protein [Novosphingobium aerophilum]MBC2652316.1 hypothetical protein [Novosphingobium aerophilum]
MTDLELRREIKGMVEGKLLQPLLRFFQFRPIHIVGKRLLITRTGDHEAVRSNKFLTPKEANGQLAFVFSAALRVRSSADPLVKFPEFFGDPKPVMAGAIALHAPTLTRKMFLPPDSEVVELLAWLSAPMPALAIDQQKLQSFASAVANELGSRSPVETTLS